MPSSSCACVKVKEFSIKKVPISNIKFDNTNPNVVSPEQMDALSKGMKKFGYLAPVILNENLEVLDGEHRVKVYETLGEKNIPAYVIKADKIDGKILRQIMNKLRGEHDFKKDTLEYHLISKAGKLNEFADLLAKPEEEFHTAMNLDKILQTEVPTIEEELETGTKCPKCGYSW